VGDAELLEWAAKLDASPAEEILAWALERYGRGLVLASSFQDCVLIDLAVRIDPGVEVVFIDTGAHFPETLAYVEEVRSRYSLNLTVCRAGPEADAWPCGSSRCCEVRKVAPLRKLLESRSGWITGLKRSDAPTRKAAPVVGIDEKFGCVKLNPLASWTDGDVAAYSAVHELPTHPLASRGYLSIGCAPTTRPVAPGEDARAGRWAGTQKTECGLHQ